MANLAAGDETNGSNKSDSEYPRFRPGAAVSEVDAGLSVHARNELPAGGAGSRSADRIRRSLPASPVSTQQILHPEKYFEHVLPTDPALPDAHLPHGYKGLVGGELGELEQGIMLEQFVGKTRAADLAAHWRGCNFELQENKKAGRVVLRYATDWDSEERAAQYFAAYREVMRKKWKNMTVSSEEADALTGTGDDGRFELRRKGTAVTSVEGLDPAIH